MKKVTKLPDSRGDWVDYNHCAMDFNAWLEQKYDTQRMENDDITDLFECWMNARGWDVTDNIPE